MAYYKIYSSLVPEMCRRLKKRLNKTTFIESGTDLLRNVVEDYKYLTQIQNTFAEGK